MVRTGVAIPRADYLPKCWEAIELGFLGRTTAVAKTAKSIYFLYSLLGIEAPPAKFFVNFLARYHARDVLRFMNISLLHGTSIHSS